MRPSYGFDLLSLAYYVDTQNSFHTSFNLDFPLDACNSTFYPRQAEKVTNERTEAPVPERSSFSVLGTRPGESCRACVLLKLRKHHIRDVRVPAPYRQSRSSIAV